MFPLHASRWVFLLLGLWTLDSGLWTSAAESTNRPAAVDYSSFKLIPDRNIFNTRRSARYTPAPSERTSNRRPARTESFALVGTMNYDGQGPLAFFEGSRSEYRQALKPEASIAGFKLASVEPASVKLVSPTNEIELKVGAQLRREDEGEWRVSARVETVTTSSAPAERPGAGRSETESTSAKNDESPDSGPNGAAAGQLAAQPTVTNTPSAGAGGGNDGDVLERLRRKREQENN